MVYVRFHKLTIKRLVAPVDVYIAPFLVVKKYTQLLSSISLLIL